MKNILLLLLCVSMFSYSANLFSQNKEVDLSITEIWPLTNGTTLDYSFSDQTHPFFGGYKFIPQQVFQGFSEIALPVNHPGSEEITFDWQMEIIENPSGSASVVFDQTNSYTLSTGEADTIYWGSGVGASQDNLSSYQLKTTLSSANDPEPSNNTATFNYNITDSIYGFMDTTNISSSFALHNNALANNGDGIGIVVDFPAPTGDPYQINSITTYLSDEYTGVVQNGNGTFYGVVWSKNEATGNWDFSDGVEAQTSPRPLTAADFNSFITIPFSTPLEISAASQYLVMLHIFNNDDQTDEGRISIGSQINFNAPADLCAVQAFNGSVELADEVPAIWVNLEPQEQVVNSEAEILTFSIPNQVNSNINSETGEIAVEMPSGTDLTSLVAEFTLSTGATATVGGTVQESGVTGNDFTNDVLYTVTAEDGTTTKEWTVSVAADLSSEAEILSYSIPGQVSSNINDIEKTVDVVMPSGTDVTSLVADFTISYGATAYVGVTEQESGVTSNDFTNPVEYGILPEDASTQVIWTVTVTIANSTEAEILTFSIPNQVNSNINSETGQIAVEMPSDTDLTSLVAEFTLSAGATATVDGTVQESGVTGNDFTNDVLYTVTAEDGTTTKEWTVSVTAGPSSEADILTYIIPTQISSSINTQEQTISIEMPAETDVTNLVAEFALSAGATATVDGTVQESGITTNDFTNTVTYTVTAADGTTSKEWDVNVTVASSGEADILSYSLPNQISSSINTQEQTISVEMPAETDVTSLVAEFTLSAGATATVDGTVQESGITTNDFTNTVTYTVTAADGTTSKDWNVTVHVEDPGEAEILEYSIQGQTTSTINADLQTISVIMPMGTDLTALVADFTLSPGAVATVDGTTQVSGVTQNDFTNDVVYAVTSEDGTETNEWTVTVTEYMTSSTDFISYSIDGNAGEIDYSNAFIRVEMPSGTDLTSLIADFEVMDGVTVEVSGTVQTSGVTANNFSEIVKYRINPESGASKYWYVQVVEEGNMNTDNSFMYFGFYGQTNPATIDAQNHTISVNLNPTLDITQLIPLFYVSEGAVVFIDSEIQWSGKNIVDFSSSVTYTVLAEDGQSSQEWTVQVTNNQNASAEITSFDFVNVPDDEEEVAIYPTSGAIYVSIPEGFSPDSLVAEFELSPGATATVGGVEQQSGVTVNDFTNPVAYTITSENGETQKNWTVTVDYVIGLENRQIESFRLYPNPAKNYLRVNVPEFNHESIVTIANIEGEVVQTYSFNGTTQTIDVSGLPEGVYVVVLRQHRAQWARKIIVN